MADPHVLVLISADAEWRVVREIISPADIHSTPLGEWFDTDIHHPSPVSRHSSLVTFFHGGWGKISAAATAQYAIDHFQPNLLVNLGTCGGFAGRIEVGTILLVTRTIVYDIIEQMGDAEEAIDHYATEIDLSWLEDRGPLTVDRGEPRSTVHRPRSIVPGLLVSADRDIVREDIPMLVEKYGAVAADWESGAIAGVAQRNGVRCLILRGVTDLVSPAGGEAMQIEVFHSRTREIMKTLIEQLPGWLAAASPE